jgi:hypothetical protein
MTEVSLKKFLIEIEDVIHVALDSVHLYRSTVPFAMRG